MASIANENIEEINENTPLLTINDSQWNWKDGLIPCRYIVTLMGMTGLMIVYALRVNLSVAMVAMVNHSAIAPSGRSNFSAECPEDVSNATTETQEGPFAWDEATQGLILGSFFWGYTSTQFIGGILATRYGGKWLFGLGVACTGGLTLLTPTVAYMGTWYLVALRILEGIGEGVTFPAKYALLAKWAPPLELTTMVTICFSGSNIGTVLALPLSGLLSQYGFDGGWPSIFYCFGSVAIIWFVFWSFLVYEDPSCHPRISQRERLYIQRALGDSAKKIDDRVPWCQIFTSVPLLSLNVGFFGYTWGFYTLLTCLPQYLEEILRYDIKENGFISAAPYLAASVVSILSGFFVDKLRQKECVSTTAIRKIANTIGMLVDAAMLLGVIYVGCDRVLAVSLLTLSSAFGVLIIAGMGSNFMDLSPRYSGILMGITNTTAQIPGILAPLTVGYFTNHAPTRESWSKVFYLASGIICLGSLAFLFFGSGKRQKFNGPDRLEIDESHSQPIVTNSLLDAERLRTLANQTESINA